MAEGYDRYGPGGPQPPPGSGPQQPPPYGPPAPYQPKPPTGEISWWLGLLGFTLIPYINTFVAGVTMLFVGLSVRKQGPLAAANGRAAANWGLTTLLLTLVLLAAVIDANDGTKSFPVWMPASLYGVLYVLHLIASIWGGVRAHRGRRVGWPAIPFFRA